MERDGRTKIF